MTRTIVFAGIEIYEGLRHLGTKCRGKGVTKKKALVSELNGLVCSTKGDKSLVLKTIEGFEIVAFPCAPKRELTFALAPAGEPHQRERERLEYHVVCHLGSGGIYVWLGFGRTACSHGASNARVVPV